MMQSRKISKRKEKLTDSEQSERFVSTAVELGIESTVKDFEESAAQIIVKKRSNKAS